MWKYSDEECKVCGYTTLHNFCINGKKVIERCENGCYHAFFGYRNDEVIAPSCNNPIELVEMLLANPV